MLESSSLWEACGDGRLFPVSSLSLARVYPRGLHLHLAYAADSEVINIYRFVITGLIPCCRNEGPAERHTSLRTGANS